MGKRADRLANRKYITDKRGCKKIYNPAEFDFTEEIHGKTFNYRFKQHNKPCILRCALPFGKGRNTDKCNLRFFKNAL